MLRLFRKKSHPSSGRQLIDIHSHLLPDIDDGPRDMEESLELIGGLWELGLKSLVTTPHISMDFYPNTIADIQSRLSEVRYHMGLRGIGLSLEAAAEYMIDDAFLETLRSGGPVLSIKKTYVLFEMGFLQEDPRLEETLFLIQARGFSPLMAHPERYSFYRGKTDYLRALKAKGCSFQLNALALKDYYGGQVKKMASSFLEAGIYSFTGSDIHHKKHLRSFGDVYNNLDYQSINNNILL